MFVIIPIYERSFISSTKKENFSDFPARLRHTGKSPISERFFIYFSPTEYAMHHTPYIGYPASFFNMFHKATESVVQFLKFVALPKGPEIRGLPFHYIVHVAYHDLRWAGYPMRFPDDEKK